MVKAEILISVGAPLRLWLGNVKNHADQDKALLMTALAYPAARKLNRGPGPVEHALGVQLLRISSEANFCLWKNASPLGTVQGEAAGSSTGSTGTPRLLQVPAA